MSTLPRQLGDGLLLRRARLEEAAELADFNAAMHADADLPAASIAEWTRDLFDAPHPTFRPDRDITVVENTTTGRIVSALFLIPQVWTYAGIPVDVGQPELIATHPDHRRRGLVRAQFDVIHEWSAAAGHVWQFISGIAWYYRQFGYAYAIDVPPRPVLWFAKDSPTPRPELSLRPATNADLGFLATLESEATSGTRLGALRGADGFALELVRRPGGMVTSEIVVIEALPEGQPIGYAALPRRLPDGLVTLRAFELRRGTSWLAPTAALIAQLYGWASNHPDGPGRGIRFALPLDHPAIRCAATQLGARPPATYGLYVRVPDLVAALRAVAPVLDTRLAGSPAVGFTGELHIDLYVDGLQLRFADGRLSSVERWAPQADEDSADARLDHETFLHLLFGNRRVGELERTNADCLLNSDTGALLLDVLFPTMPMSTWEFC